MIQFEQKDSERLRVVRMQLNELKSMLPEMCTPDGSKITQDVKTLIDKIINHIKTKTDETDKV